MKVLVSSSPVDVISSVMRLARLSIEAMWITASELVPRVL